jgi:hypothetical protein
MEYFITLFTSTLILKIFASELGDTESLSTLFFCLLKTIVLLQEKPYFFVSSSVRFRVKKLSLHKVIVFSSTVQKM